MLYGQFKLIESEANPQIKKVKHYCSFGIESCTCGPNLLYDPLISDE